MRLTRLRAILGCTLALTLYACNNGVNQENHADAQDIIQIVTVETDIAQLKQSTTIAGQPNAVWWARTIMGKSGSDQVPGPTDSLLTAIIDYGSKEKVADLVGESGGRVVRLVGSDWFPDELMKSSMDDEGRIPAQQYKNVPGFPPEALIRVPERMPSLIIMELVKG